MKTILSFLLIILYSPGLLAGSDNGAYDAIDKKALQIPAAQASTTAGIASYVQANFSTDADKVRAIFIWTATNIEYDVDNMYAINFYEKTEEKIDKALKTHKGICENYAAVFNDVCQKCGLRSFVIAGYTQQGGIGSFVPHAWCATMVDGNWQLYDPTWASGYVDNNTFVRKINNTFYKTEATTMIKTHKPFDPMWELLYYPITNPEFSKGLTDINKSKPYFSYPDSIDAYERLNEREKLLAETRRTEQNGVNNAMVFNRLANLKQTIEINKQMETVHAQNETVTLYNQAVVEYNEGINDMNTFIQYRNKQFMPKKTDPQIQGMIDSVQHKLDRASALLKDIKDPEVTVSAMIGSLKKSLSEASKAVEEQNEFLRKYFSTSKLLRKTLFYRKA